MKCSFPGAGLVGIGLLSLLTACASTSTDSDAGNKKVASANCEVVGPTIGSNMSHRSCANTSSTQSDKPSTPQ
jgi:hypothetical protein